MRELINVGFATAVTATIFGFFGEEPAGAFFTGWITSMVNVGIMIWAIHSVLVKKSIAQRIVAIVSKCAVLAGIVYLAVRMPTVSTSWFLAGVVLALPGLIFGCGCFQEKFMRSCSER